ncbi:NAD(P)/FAD-dependent oxidoreductase [Saccharopolyspora gregorii]|uniref:NAD(P)/FAD-dependent oxidoreductase n=1 Tax=Saccharopolyspora gregorii TaxID=33914 RepID=UPI0021ACAFFC|nr:FAD-binding oxidoreductase [Saccharopolyspora gregorii]
MTPPGRAEVVVIGGGAMGTSIAFHLAEAGADVLLLERGELGSGSTGKAAGGVRAQFSDPVNIELGARSLHAFARFDERPGGCIDLRRNGYLFLLTDPADVAAFEESVRLQNACGVPSRMLTAREAGELSPPVSVDGVLAGAFSPTDGHCTPDGVVQGYAAGARRCGARIQRHCAVTGIEVTGGAVTGVRTDAGPVATSAVVCAAGAWSAAVGAMAGVELPVRPLRRQILVTEPAPGLPDRLPFTIDFGTGFYFHEEGLGLLMGMPDPVDSAEPHLDDGWLELLADTVERRAPALAALGAAHRWAGLYELSPDHNALIGSAAEVRGFLYATGFSGHGFLQSPAVGEVVRDLVLDRPPPVDVSGLGVDRFARDEHRPERNLV